MSDNLHVIKFGGRFYAFTKNEDDQETQESFWDRCWFIVKNMNKHSHDYSYLEKISKIWANVKHLGVSYNDDIMSTLKEFDM